MKILSGILSCLTLVFMMFIIFVSTPVHAQDISETQSSAERDLLEAIDRLNKIRSDIAKEKIPIARTISQKETSILDLRKRAAQIQSANDNKTMALEDIKEDLKEWEEESRFLTSLLDEYTRLFESDLNASEVEKYKTQLDAFNALDTNQVGEARINIQLQIIDQGFSRIRKALDGDIFDGKIVADDGIIYSGNIARFGPLAYFFNKDKDIKGLVVDEGRKIAHLFTGASGLKNLSKLFEGQLVDIPVDVTNGKAINISADSDGLFEHLRKGGIWIIPILLLAGLSITASIWKLTVIYKIKLPEKISLYSILAKLKQGDQKAAMEVAKSIPFPVGDMLIHGVQHATEPKELVEETMYECMLDTKPKLEKYLPLIAISAATAPLLGLLGTVTGMINTFQLITLFGTGDAQSLSSGISEALITTEFGLVVAIPALIMHALLSRKVHAIMTDMEKFSVIFVNGMSRGHG